MNYAESLEGYRHLHIDYRHTLAVVTETGDSIEFLKYLKRLLLAK